MNTEVPTPHFFSATQIDTFLLCPRKWAWKYIAKKDSPQHASAQLGTLIHELLENYLKTGESLPFSHEDPEVRKAAKIAAAGLHLIPKPGTPGMTVEREFAFETDDGLLFYGKKDIEIQSGTGEPEVWDHKSTSDMKWAKTPEQLKSDVQANLYAYEAMAKHEAPAVNLNWVYYQTRGPSASKKVHLRLTSEQVTPLFFQIKALLPDVLSILKNKTDPLAIPGDARACDAYGGCPYMSECNPHITNVERLKAMMSTQAISLLDKLNARKAQMNGIVNTELPKLPPDSHPDVSPTPTMSGGASNILAKLKAKSDAALVPCTIETPAPQVTHCEPAPVVAINPPGEYQPPPASAEARDKPQEEPGEKPAKRGRPRKVKAEEAPAEERTLPLPGFEIETKPAVQIVDTAKGFSLYVDCVPITFPYPVTPAEDVFASAKERIMKTHDLADYRYAEYGKGPAIFQETLSQMADAGEIAGAIILNSRTPEGQLAMAPLMPRAVSVVRGFG